MESLGEQGSHFTYKESRFALTPTAQQVLKPDPSRVAVIWSNNIMNTAFLTIDQSSTANEGIAVPLGVLPYHWLFKDLGGIVQGAVWAHAVAGAILHVVEVLYTPRGPRPALGDPEPDVTAGR
jgi:hypothetical protein